MMGHRWWGSSVETYVLGEAGTYYFKVYGNSQTHSDSTYKLTPSFELGVSGLETGPNGEHENADAMNFGEEMTGNFSVGDVDWYKISVTVAGTLTLDGFINGKEGESEWEIHISRREFDWSNPEWMMGRWWGSSVETYVLGEAGTYFFKVYGNSQTHSDSTYKLTPSLSWGYRLETEPNGEHKRCDELWRR